MRQNSWVRWPQIDVLVPTWGRPERLREMVHSAFMSAERTPPGGLQVWVRVSLEDPKLDEYLALRHAMTRVHMHFVRGHDSYAKGIELLRKVATGDVFFCGGDDTLFRTPGWDVRVEEAFAAVADRLLIAYANNGMDREKCEHFFVAREWVDTVGYLMREEFEHFCCDQYVEELARGIGRLQFLRGVTVEHLHKKYGKAPDDDTYRRVRGKTGTNARDLATFARLAPERALALQKLKMRQSLLVS